MEIDNEKFEKHKRVVWKFAKAATLDEEAADEITQEVFLYAWEKRELFKSAASPAGLLFTMAKHKTYSYFRRRRCRILEFEPYRYAQPEETLLEEIIQHENAREMRDAIDSLPDKYSRVILLRYYYGMSLVEIAKMTGENYNTLTSRNGRALALLRTKLSGMSGPDGPGRRQKPTIKTFILLYEV